MLFSRASVARSLTAVLIGLAAAGCSPGTDGASDRPAVVTSIYPLQFLAEYIGGDHVEVSTLASNSGAHEVELTIAQTASLSDADLVVYLKGFESAVDEAVEQAGPDRVVELSDVVDLRSLEGEEEEAHDHDHGPLDPHFWLDPERMGSAAEAVTSALSVAAPDRSDDFRANLAQLLDDLHELDTAYADGLGRCELSTVVVSHDAFGYLEKYGLEFASIAGISPEAEPSLQHVAELQDMISDAGVTTVFAEPQESSGMAQTIAADLDLDVALLDPVEGLSDDTADEDYLSLMAQNLDALRKANRCQ